MARRGSYAKGIAKREEILETALAVIAQSGYKNTSVRELADAVGLSQAGLLHYFTSKDELFAEILRKRDEADIAKYSNTPDVSIFESIRNVVAHNAEVAGLVKLYVQLSSDAVQPDHAAHQFFVQRQRAFREELESNIRDSQASGLTRADVDPAKAATMTLALADGLQSQWLLDPEMDMAAHIDAFLALLAPQSK